MLRRGVFMLPFSGVARVEVSFFWRIILIGTLQPRLSRRGGSGHTAGRLQPGRPANFGDIHPEDGSPDVFYHESDLDFQFNRRELGGIKVKFDKVPDPKKPGFYVAKNVQLL